MDYGWKDLAELREKLSTLLLRDHEGYVTSLSVALDGDVVVLRGEVGSEACRGDAKRFALAFDGVFKVRNELVVAAFLEPATGSGSEDDFFLQREFRQVRRSGPKTADVKRRPSRIIVAKSDGPGRRAAPRPQARLQAPPPPDPVEVHRTPVVRTTGAPVPGGWVEIVVDLSTVPAAGVPPISLGRHPRNWPFIEVTVQLFAPWAGEMIVETPSVVVASDGGSRPARFRCRASDDHDPASVAMVQISFLHGTRVCGHITWEVAPAVETGAGPAAAAAEQAASPPEVRLVPEAAGPALSISISCDGRGGQVWMWSAFVPGATVQDAATIDLGGLEQAFADGLLAACPGLQADEFRRAMRGVGERIWRAAPERFRSSYLNLRAVLGPSFAIQFVTDDPHVPWEMMKPDLEGLDHVFLAHPVARWPLTRAARRPHALPGGAVLSFVPKYSGGRSLPSAVEEGEWICRHLGGERMEATRLVFLDVLDGRHPRPVGLIHFAGHGSVDTGMMDGGVEMEDRIVGVSDVDQSGVVVGERDGTLIVLNACETGAGARMLGMNTGWGAAIAARGFGGLIAPLWEVQDDVALAMVQALLPPLLDGRARLGEAVVEARRRSGETSISAFAYLAHGDVMARFPTS